MDIEKIKQYLESEEGRKESKEFFLKFAYNDTKGIERISSMIKELSDDELDEWMDKFVKWETKYENMWLDRGVETSSNLFNCLFAFIKKEGVCLYDAQEDFLVEAYKWRGYTFKLYQGQGCFYTINKQIF